MSSREPRICIVGAGMSGMLMAIKLLRAGIRDFVIYEKSTSVGGTWRENRYPGVACDVASFSYCYAFEPNPEWSHRFSPGPEIRRYFERVAEKYGLLPFIRFGTEVRSAVWSDGAWQVETTAGDSERFDVMVAATGPLHHIKYPDIPGLDSFAGKAVHTAAWDEQLDLRGKRVGVIGTGSSAVQLTAPVAELAAKLTLFQRTAQWIMPTPNPRYSPLAIELKRRFPVLGRLTRLLYDWVGEQFGQAALADGWRRRMVDWMCRRNLASIKDPELRRKLTPDHKAMCKRMIVSDTFYPALQRDNVEVVTDAIERIAPEGVVTRDGRLHPLDVLVLATGFYPNAWGVERVVGEGGVSLRQAWESGTRSYRSIAVPGFPNYFMLIGPNSPITNLSLIEIAEIGSDYVMQCIDGLRQQRYRAIAPRVDVTEAFTRSMKAAFTGTIWVSGCNSWYLDADGVPATWPWTPARYRRELSRPDLADFELCR